MAISESCPTDHLEGLSTKLIIKVCPLYMRWRVVLKVNQWICLEIIFIHGTSMCERVSEDSRYEIRHVNIRVGIMNSLECVCLSLHEHLGGE